MRGKQDADAFVLGKLEKDLQQFVPGNGIQPAGGFVQHQKPRPVRECQSQGVLYLHALGKLFHSFVFIQREQREIPAVSRLVPARIKAARYIRDCAKLLFGIMIYAAGNKANAALDIELIVTKAFAEKQNLAAVGMNKIEQGFERCGFTRAVAPDKTHNLPLPYVEAYIPQLKFFIFLT